MPQPEPECCIPVITRPGKPEPIEPCEPKCATYCQEVHYRAKTLAKLARAFKVYVEQELEGAENCLAQTSTEKRKSKKEEKPEDEGEGDDESDDKETGEGQEGDEKEAEGEFFQALSEFFSEELGDKLKDQKAAEKMCKNVEEWRDSALEKMPFFSEENEEAVNNVLTELCSTYVEAIGQQGQ